MPDRITMNVSLTAELQAFVQELIATGRYSSASEVVRDGLRGLEDAERRRLLEKAVAEGLTPDEEKRVSPEKLAQVRAAVQSEIQRGLDFLGSGPTLDGAEFLDHWRQRLRRSPAKAQSQYPLSDR